LFGDHITEADIRLYPTLIRFDVAYFTIFKCNLKMIRHDYPQLHDWLRRLYWDESEATNYGSFKKTVDFQAVREHWHAKEVLVANPFLVQGGILKRYQSEGCACRTEAGNYAFVRTRLQSTAKRFLR
jgi:glutathionyl-hydroquinone reductase